MRLDKNFTFIISQIPHRQKGIHYYLQVLYKNTTLVSSLDNKFRKNRNHHKTDRNN